MQWQETEPGTWVGRGRKDTYLVWYETTDGRVKLTRWERRGEFETHRARETREAVSHLVSQKPVPRFGEDPDVPDAEHAMTLVRMQADMFESGRSLPELDRGDWVHLPDPDLYLDLHLDPGTREA